jgi:hypothetical protein
MLHEQPKKTQKKKLEPNHPIILFGGFLVLLGTNHHPKLLSVLESQYSGTTTK